MPSVRSSSSRTPAASSTANPSRPRIAVTSQVQQVSGMRIRVIPLQRRSTVVAMKLMAPIREAPQKIAMLRIHRFWPMPSPGPVTRPAPLKRRVRGPSRQGRAAFDEEGRHHHDQSEERGPERHHVQHRKRHVFGADLDRQEIVAEAALRHRGQHEEHHDGAVHGHEREIQFGRHHAAGRGRGPEFARTTARPRWG